MFFLDDTEDENSKKDQSTDQVVDPLNKYAADGVKGFSENPGVILSELTNKDIWSGLLKSLTDVAGNYETLVKSSQLLANSMGIGQARANELKLTIADTLPELTKVGLTTSESFKAMQEAPVALGTNTIIARETIVELGATTKFTDISVENLAKTFKNAGFELGNVAETMADVANYAKSVGTNVLAVTQMVSKNLQQLNLFNFENGVDGLAKMASSATMLGYDMSTVMEKAEKLLSPEAAIEFSASLQRLGVTSTELLDPLSAMDMAMNNPERLAKEMEGVAKQFVQLKADGSGFEIMPGAKLQLREVANELGMNADQFAKMALRSADFDMKMQQIRFPSFAASEEDKMLIANMAQMKDGRAVVQIEEGDELKEVAVEDLTAEQLKELQKEQANQNKTAEELAIDQLNVLQKIQQNTAAGIQATKLGAASSGPIRRYLDTLQDIRLAGTENTLGKIETKEVRGAVQGVTKPLESALVDFVKDPSIENLTGILPAFTKSVGSLGSSVEKLISGTGNSLVGISDQIYNSLSKTYGDVGTQKGSVTSFVSESMNYENKTNQLETKSTNNVNVNQNVSGKIDITLSSNGGITQDQMNELIQKDQLGKEVTNLLTNDVNVRNATASAAKNPDPFNK